MQHNTLTALWLKPVWIPWLKLEHWSSYLASIAWITRLYIWGNFVANFAASDCHNSLWPKATTSEMSQRGYSLPEDAIIHCGQRTQHLRGQREAIHWVGRHSLLLPKATTFKKSQWPVNLTILVYCNCHGILSGVDKFLNLISFISKLCSVIEQPLGCKRSLEELKNRLYILKDCVIMVIYIIQLKYGIILKLTATMYPKLSVKTV